MERERKKERKKKKERKSEREREKERKREKEGEREVEKERKQVSCLFPPPNYLFLNVFFFLLPFAFSTPRTFSHSSSSCSLFLFLSFSLSLSLSVRAHFREIDISSLHTILTKSLGAQGSEGGKKQIEKEMKTDCGTFLLFFPLTPLTPSFSLVLSFFTIPSHEYFPFMQLSFVEQRQRPSHLFPHMPRRICTLALSQSQ